MCVTVGLYSCVSTLSNAKTLKPIWKQKTTFSNRFTQITQEDLRKNTLISVRHLETVVDVTDDREYETKKEVI